MTLIDPASGSGHILVEVYDLFKAIYLERGYRQRDVARLILTQNLFGLDIDERAAQLTGFALMMKGRADDRRLFERAVKLNVMALVDSAGFDAEGLAKGVEIGDFGLQPGDLTELKRLFEHATTFGSLIQVPEKLAEKLPALKQLSEATSQDLFVSDTLKRLGPLAQQAELLAAQYDAVVANPPYMGTKFHNTTVKNFAQDYFPDAKTDLFTCFIERAVAQSAPGGRIGIIAPFVWMYLSSYKEFRRRFINETSLTSLIELEYNAFEPAMVPVAAFTLIGCHVSDLTGSFIKLSEFKGHQNQAPRTLQAIADPDCDWLYKSKADDFKKIPSSPVAYWVSDALRALFTSLPSLSVVASPRKGMVTADNLRFLRLWQEVSLSNIGFGCDSRDAAASTRRKWFPYTKGGSFRRWSGNYEYVVNWQNDGRELLQMKENGYKVGSTNHNLEFIFRPAITWTRITSRVSGFRVTPVGFLFDDASGLCPVKSAIAENLVLGLLNSPVTTHVLGALNPTLTLNSGDLCLVPIDTDQQEPVAAKLCVELATRDWNIYERSWDFQSLPLLTASSDLTPTLESSYTAWITQNRDTIAEMKRLEEENNRLFIDAYGLGEELTPNVPIEQITLTVNPAYRYSGKLTIDAQWTRFRQDTMEELVSYAIGCMMGRYSLDAPGLIYAHSGNKGFDQAKYTTFPADADGIVPLTDTEWFDDDACHRLIKFVSVAWDASHLKDNLTFLADNLSPKKGEVSRETIRRYLCDSFFKDHLKTYKKRPIYWLFSSGKLRAFQCLVYLHRYNEGTLSRMRTEYEIPLQGKISARIEQLAGDISAATSTAHSKKLERERGNLIKQQVELQAFDEKLRHYADQRISLDLDDGVKVNYGKFGDLLAEVKAVTGKK